MSANDVAPPPRSKLAEFVKNRSVAAVSEALGVGIFSTYHYLRGTRHMRVGKVKKLLEFAGGELTSEDIETHYELCAERRRRGLVA